MQNCLHVAYAVTKERKKNTGGDVNDVNDVNYML